MPQLAQKTYLTHSGLQHCLLFYFILFYASSYPNALQLAALHTVLLVSYFIPQLGQKAYPNAHRRLAALLTVQLVIYFMLN
jgi:hypothetical protein